MADMRPQPRLLHVHGSFSLGGKAARSVRLMNIWGDKARHSVVSADLTSMGARDAIDPAVPVDFPTSPPLAGRPGIARFKALAQFMRGYDLILSYNWGAMDAVMAHRFANRFGVMPPLIHHEDGFNADEAGGLMPKRNFYRRVGLMGARAVVVPSVGLEAIARTIWKQPIGKLHLIRNGIDVDLYAAAPLADTLPGLCRSPEKVLVGTLAGLRAVKNLPRLVRAVAQHRNHVQLVIVGEGPERGAIAAEAASCGLHDICFAGFKDRPWRFMGLFDIFALSSDSEQFPISLVEAMAAGLPVAATDVGDIATMVAPENSAFIVSDEQGLADAIGALARDEGMRARLGEANRLRAARDFTEQAMVDAYARLYGEALAMPTILR